MSTMTAGRWVASATVGLFAAGLAWWVAAGGEDRPFSPGSAADVMTAASPLATFPPLELPSEAFEASWATERNALGTLTPGDEELLASWYAVQLVTALSAVERFDGDGESLQREHEFLVTEYVRTRGVARFRALGHVAWDRFATTLLALLERSPDHGGVEALLQNPLDPVVHAHLEAGGDFARQGLRTGMLSDDGSLHLPPALLRVVFRFGWLSQLRSTFPLEQTMPGPELRVFYRWRIEQAENLPIETRLRWLDEYMTMFGSLGEHPAAYWRAVLLTREGREAEAQALLRTLAAAEPRYEAYLTESAEPQAR